ncbi:MAG: alpha-amylase family glycosyl hydrolase, partial [Candidatus Promineifilaceae bacterium]|nr:alpha-amylase family glycosyl hydrolase [Candidatus Promineifilaceae bacterium]
RHDDYFSPYFSRPSFLDNHDVNRFLWLVDGDVRKLKLAALCHVTLPGPPIVYYGTEVGLSQERDVIQEHGHVLEEARAPMLWGDAQDADLRQYYRRLIRFRRAHPVLWRGRRRTVHVEPAAGTYAYACSAAEASGDETVLVALNAGDVERTFTAAGHRLSLAPWSGEIRVI